MKRLKLLGAVGLSLFAMNTFSVNATEISAETVSIKCMSYDGAERMVDVKLVENFTRVEIPDREYDFKSYMDYRKLGKYSQKDLQGIAETDEDGFRRVDDRYIVAVGTAVCEEVGTYITLVLENGTTIEAVVGDIKDDKHTDESNIVTVANNCCTEFIIDSDVMSSKILRSGSVSNFCDEWKSKVIEILVYNENILESNTLE